jgi:peptide/nickel transport system substrate-binding protein
MKLPVVVDFMVPNTTDTRQMAEVIQAMAAEGGFDLKIRLTEFATSLKESEDGKFQAYLIGWSGRVDPDGNVFSFVKTKAPNNVGGYSNADVDTWLDEQRTVSDPAARKAIYEKITQKVLSEGAIIYLTHRPVIVAHSKAIQGYKQLPDGLVRVVGVKVGP